jgi:hypothetical protein
MSACGNINMGSSADCDNLPPGGTAAKLTLFNFDDIQNFVEDVDGNITDIIVKPGAYGYQFLGFRNDVKKAEEVIKPEVGIPKFKHTVGFVVYENTQVQKNNVENIARGRFTAVVENKGKSELSYEVVGKEVGVEIVAGPLRNAHENGGFFVISLATPDDQGELEPKLPQTLKATPAAEESIYEATTALLDSLIQPVTPLVIETSSRTIVDDGSGERTPKRTPVLESETVAPV